MKNQPIFTLPKALSDAEVINLLVINIAKKNFLPKDLGITSRTIAHWKEKELLPLTDKERKWQRFDFVEYLWLRFVQDFRKLGCSLETIKKIRDEMFAIKDLDVNEHRKEMEKSGNMLGYDVEQKINATEEIRTGNYKKMPELQVVRNLFGQLLLNALLMKNNNNGIMVTLEGEVFPWTDDILKIDKKLISIFNTPHVFIPFRHYIFQFIDDASKELFLSPLEILDENELLVLKAMRNKDYKEIIIKPVEIKSGEDNTYEIITVKDGELTPAQQKEITDILQLKNYQSITLKKRSNTQIYFERTHRR
jgi:DNA-binding transcriptional MerR regulator